MNLDSINPSKIYYYYISTTNNLSSNFSYLSTPLPLYYPFKEISIYYSIINSTSNEYFSQVINSLLNHTFTNIIYLIYSYSYPYLFFIIPSPFITTNTTNHLFNTNYFYSFLLHLIYLFHFINQYSFLLLLMKFHCSFRNTFIYYILFNIHLWPFLWIIYQNDLFSWIR